MTKRPGLRWKSVSLKATRRLTAGLAHHRWPAWSPDGRWLAFAIGEGRAAMWVVTDRRGRVARALEGPVEGGCSFAPDGALAYGRRAGEASEIWLAPAGGAPPVRLLGGDGKSYREPAFSPDGKRLVFAAADRAELPTHLQILELESGARRPLPSDPARSDGRPAFAPDGELYFEGRSDGEVAVWALAPELETAVRVTVSGAPSRRPAPLSRDLVVVERAVDSGPDGSARSRLVLVDRVAVRERELEPAAPRPGKPANKPSGKPPGKAEPRAPRLRFTDPREPSVQRAKSGKVKLAFTAILADESDEQPRRFEICSARLRGVTVAGSARAGDPAPEESRQASAPESPPEPTAPSGEPESTAA